ncbi:hypothetical protein BsWGS_10134 [Bradybaena similaris]
MPNSIAGDGGNNSPTVVRYDTVLAQQHVPNMSNGLGAYYKSSLDPHTENGLHFPSTSTSFHVPFVDATATALYPTLQPALPSTVQMSLTVVYIAMFSFIFILVYVQLWMIWYYRHKRLSHQTLFLYMCLIWAGLRTSLFSFYFNNCDQANNMSLPWYWMLYSLPVCLQFSMLCLLLHFFAQVVFKAKAKYEPKQYKNPLRIFLAVSVAVFIAVNIAITVVTKHHERHFNSIPFWLIYIRVIMTETMFFIYGTLLSISIFKMTKMTSTQRVLEAKGTTVCKAVAAAILITLLFLSRTVYNIISMIPAMKGAPNFGFDWINVTDQADAIPRLSESLAYVSFGVVLFVWEVLPISIVVIFFRVKRLSSGQVLTDFSTQSHGSRVFFFDNPRRYDSEDDLASTTNSAYSDAAGSRSFNGDSYRSVTPKGTPINSSLWGATVAPSPLLNSTSAHSGIVNDSSGMYNPRMHSYGAINVDRNIQSGSYTGYVVSH